MSINKYLNISYGDELITHNSASDGEMQGAYWMIGRPWYEQERRSYRKQKYSASSEK